MNEESELPQFKIIGNEDGTATLELGTQSVTISLEDLEALIAGLADLRARHPIQVSDTPEWTLPGATHRGLEAIPNPRWYVQQTALHESVLVSLRHPGYGWIPFEIPYSEATNLVRIVQRQIETPQASGSA